MNKNEIANMNSSELKENIEKIIKEYKGEISKDNIYDIDISVELTEYYLENASLDDDVDIEEITIGNYEKLEMYKVGSIAYDKGHILLPCIVNEETNEILTYNDEFSEILEIENLESGEIVDEFCFPVLDICEKAEQLGYREYKGWERLENIKKSYCDLLELDNLISCYGENDYSADVQRTKELLPQILSSFLTYNKFIPFEVTNIGYRIGDFEFMDFSSHSIEEIADYYKKLEDEGVISNDFVALLKKYDTGNAITTPLKNLESYTNLYEYNTVVFYKNETGTVDFDYLLDFMKKTDVTEIDRISGTMSKTLIEKHLKEITDSSSFEVESDIDYSQREIG